MILWVVTVIAIQAESSLLYMAGTTGLEPATSAVTVLPFQIFQRLTNPWGTPKATEVVEDHTFCGSDCGSDLSILPTQPYRGAHRDGRVIQGVMVRRSGNW